MFRIPVNKGRRSSCIYLSGSGPSWKRLLLFRQGEFECKFACEADTMCVRPPRKCDCKAFQDNHTTKGAPNTMTSFEKHTCLVLFFHRMPRRFGPVQETQVFIIKSSQTSAPLASLVFAIQGESPLNLELRCSQHHVGPTCLCSCDFWENMTRFLPTLPLWLKAFIWRPMA